MFKKSTDIWLLEKKWKLIDFNRTLLYFYSMENLYYKNGTSSRTVQDNLLPDYSLENLYNQQIKTSSNHTNSITQEFYTKIWSNDKKSSNLIAKIMNSTYTNIFYNYNGVTLESKSIKEFTLSNSLLQWLASANRLNSLIKTYSIQNFVSLNNHMKGKVNNLVMYLSDNLANILNRGSEDVENIFYKMYKDTNENFQTYYAIFLVVFSSFLIGSMVIIILLLIILSRKFRYIYDCYANMKMPEIDLQIALGTHCIQLFKIFKFNENKLIEEFLEQETIYKGIESEVKEKYVNAKRSGAINELN